MRNGTKEQTERDVKEEKRGGEKEKEVQTRILYAINMKQNSEDVF